MTISDFTQTLKYLAHTKFQVRGVLGLVLFGLLLLMDNCLKMAVKLDDYNLCVSNILLSYAGYTVKAKRLEPARA